MHELIQHQVLTNDASSITFSSIPQTYTDLYLVLSARSSGTDEDVTVTFNTSGGTYSCRRLFASGSSGTIGSDTQTNQWLRATANADTASTFSNSMMYLSSYSSSSVKNAYCSWVTENNGTRAVQGLIGGLWTGTSAITNIRLQIAGANLRQGSSATLYGINRTTTLGRNPQAVGGYINYANGYWYHVFTGSGNFIPFNNMQVEYVVVAGGGSGGYDRGSGGGAGGYRSSVLGEFSGANSSPESTLSLVAGTNYPVTVGAGGATQTGYGQSTPGSNSVFSSITAVGGGTGTAGAAGGGGAGGSGGGGASQGPASGGAGTAGQGFAGGASLNSGGGSGGGGGAGGPGINGIASSGAAGAGGPGIPSAITGTVTFRAGGGGGGAAMDFGLPRTAGAGGIGGGGAGSQTNGGAGSPGAANTGGGGGGGANIPQGNGGAGGSGVVIVRYRG